MQIEEITDTGELEALREEWGDLFDRCPAATPFQSPEWLLPWWRHLGRGRLRTLALRQEGRLVALAPLWIGSYYGLPLRTLSFLGTGASDYLDFLIDPQVGAGGAAALLAHVAERRSLWDLCDLQQLPPNSFLLSAGGSEGLRREVGKQEVCPVLPLPGEIDAFLGSLPAGRRSQVRQYRRRLERETEGGEACPHGWESADKDTLEPLLEALFDLHQARWNRRRLPGCFLGARIRRFHREVAAGFLQRGCLALYGLRLAGTIRAALYCFVRGDCSYYYAAGWDESLARFSPGTLLLAHAMEDAIRRGASQFDFMRGDEPYKYRWGAEDRVNHQMLLWKPGWPGRLAPFLQGVERRVECTGKRLARRMTEKG